jgi:phospholipid/cholesterol/gamma-HCH transport system ATP-binding protein
MREKVIEVQGLEKSFDHTKIFYDVNFSLYKKENLIILGRSGAGKTVLLRSVIGLAEPDKGSISVLGKNLFDLRDQELFHMRQKIGYLFQGAALYDSMTVSENLEFALKRQSKPLSKNSIREKIENSLERVGLKNSINKMPADLSGGMKQRVALARTLVLEPEVILYDEPTTGLDHITSKEINLLILEMREKLGISSIIVTHDMATVRMAGDRILIFDQGTIRAEGNYQELSTSDKDWIRAFFD